MVRIRIRIGGSCRGSVVRIRIGGSCVGGVDEGDADE